MDNLFYRFRKVENLLGKYEELEKQSIYFAAPHELNDPMEGHSDIYWRGDKIVWKNLFRNYVLCLEHVFGLLCIYGEEHGQIIEQDIIPNRNIDDYETQLYKDTIEQILEDFFDDNITNLIDKICNRSTPVKSDELYYYLQIVHIYAFNTIRNNFEKANLIPKSPIVRECTSNYIKTVIERGFFENLEELVQERGEDAITELCAALRYQKDQLNLIQNFNGSISERKNLYFIMFTFTEKYIKKLENLCYSDWYTACFMSKCTNSSIWGSYGDNHAGVCLIFKSEKRNEKYVFPLRAMTGYSMSEDESEPAPHYDFSEHLLQEVNYQEEFVSYNFFTSLGVMNGHTLRKMWFSDSAGEHSTCSKEVWDNISKWRENYWDNYTKRNITKTKDWAYENEYRVILGSFFHDYSDKKKRTLTYDFNSLHGLIFGINTKVEDKIKIINIIKNKCKKEGREKFNFYQAYYSNKDKCIQHSLLNLLNFNDESVKVENAT